MLTLMKLLHKLCGVCRHMIGWKNFIICILYFTYYIEMKMRLRFRLFARTYRRVTNWFWFWSPISAVLRWAAVWPHQTWAAKWRYCPPFQGEVDPHLRQCGLGQGLPPYQVASWSTSRLATTDMGPKLGGCAPLGEGSWVSPSNSMSPGPRSTSLPSGILIHLAVWPHQTWAENWGLCPFGWQGLPSKTMSTEPRPTFVPSGIWIHPAVWPQQRWAEN